MVDTIEVNTDWFSGNYSPSCRIQGIYYEPDGEPNECEILIKERAATVASRGDKIKDGRMGLAATDKETQLVKGLNSENWEDLIPQWSLLGAGYKETCRTFFKLTKPTLLSHIRLCMGPDGGIARFRCYGVVKPNINSIMNNNSNGNDEIDLAYVENGGIAIGCSNQHYGHPRNLTNPGRGLVMGDGWETARQPKRPPVYERGSDGLMVLPGSDYAVLQLGIPGLMTRLDVDTNHYKGNYPESCLIEGCYINSSQYSKSQLKEMLCTDLDSSTNSDAVQWFPILPRSALTISAQHFFDTNSGIINTNLPVSHVKLTIYPDGGVQRLRVYGKPSDMDHSRL
jgi:allantoicase